MSFGLAATILGVAYAIWRGRRYVSTIRAIIEEEKRAIKEAKDKKQQ